MPAGRRSADATGPDSGSCKDREGLASFVSLIPDHPLPSGAAPFLSSTYFQKDFELRQRFDFEKILDEANRNVDKPRILYYPKHDLAQMRRCCLMEDADG